MTKDISENDLPSIKFEKEIKELMNYRELENSSKDSSFDHDKRCRHFKYLINTIISKITLLSDNIEKLRDIQNSNNGQSILNNISNRKGGLAIILQEETRKGGDYTIIDNKCGINKLDSIFPSIICNSRVEPASETYAHTPSSNNFGTGESNDDLVTQLKSSLEVLPYGRQISPAIPGGSETNNDSSSNIIVLVSLPILGVLALSFLIYKYTPLGSKFHAYYRNKGDIPINQDYEETEQMLSNTPNLNDMYSENMQYNLSYQTL
ncbi:PIR Superfamily Protein [Plasmodium ovale curtisi]|uniref:PIR Superfamily Protein n=1 Tax=Plasmodium ovale curtisi TaxID=864141 RepID=A0A1A8XCA1_PLAOA|nr:PIR Superfamily Protein [Plasmodium ovale curtisi]